MNIRGIAICLLALSLPQQLGATSIDFSSITFAPGRPTLSDSLADAVQDRALLEEAIAHSLQLIRRVPHIKYQSLAMRMEKSALVQDVRALLCAEHACFKRRSWRAALQRIFSATRQRWMVLGLPATPLVPTSS